MDSFLVGLLLGGAITLFMYLIFEERTEAKEVKQ